MMVDLIYKIPPAKIYLIDKEIDIKSACESFKRKNHSGKKRIIYVEMNMEDPSTYYELNVDFIESVSTTKLDGIGRCSIDFTRVLNRLSQRTRKRIGYKIVLVLNLKRQWTMRQAEFFIYCLKASRPDFGIIIQITNENLELVKKELPFQYQMLCELVDMVRL